MSWPQFNVLGVALAGLLGSLAMWVVGRMAMLADLPALDPAHVINAKILGYHTDRITGLGEVLHLVNGVILALVYALLVHPLPGPEALKGLAYGIALWLVLMVLILPRLGEGPFGLKLGPAAPIISLLMHLLYGTIVAVAFRFF